MKSAIFSNVSPESQMSSTIRTCLSVLRGIQSSHSGKSRRDVLIGLKGFFNQWLIITPGVSPPLDSPTIQSGSNLSRTISRQRTLTSFLISSQSYQYFFIISFYGRAGWTRTSGLTAPNGEFYQLNYCPMERVTRFELVTFTLARWRSTSWTKLAMVGEVGFEPTHS